MKKKMNYEAPVTEQIQVRIEQNIMSVMATNKPDMATETWDDWD